MDANEIQRLNTIHVHSTEWIPLASSSIRKFLSRSKINMNATKGPLIIENIEISSIGIHDCQTNPSVQTGSFSLRSSHKCDPALMESLPWILLGSSHGFLFECSCSQLVNHKSLVGLLTTKFDHNGDLLHSSCGLENFEATKNYDASFN